MSDSDEHSDDQARLSPQSSQRGTIKKGHGWSEEEHTLFLRGLAALGKGNWRGISKLYVKTRTPTQVASHAQKYFLRLSGCCKRKSRFTTIEQKMGPPSGSEPVPSMPSAPAPMDYLTAAAVPHLHKLHQQSTSSQPHKPQNSQQTAQHQQPSPRPHPSYPAATPTLPLHSNKSPPLPPTYAAPAPTATLIPVDHAKPAAIPSQALPPPHPTTHTTTSSSSVLSATRLFAPISSTEAQQMGLASSGLVYKPEPERSSAGLSLFAPPGRPQPAAAAQHWQHSGGRLVLSLRTAYAPVASVQY